MISYWATRMKSRVASVVELEDMESGAALGLLHSIRRYEPSRGIKFETFASTRMFGAMKDELRGMDWVPRLVRSRKEQAVEMRSMDTFVPDLRYPREMAEAVDHRSPFMAAAARDLWARLRKILRPSESAVLERYYREDLTLKEIGREIGLSESRCCQLLSNAQRRVRKAWGA